MRRWSIVPPAAAVTYVVPMTPAASAAQVAMMQNRQRLMSRAEQIEHALDDAHDKAENAFEMAADAQEQLTKNIYQSQGVMYLLIAFFIILVLFIMR